MSGMHGMIFNVDQDRVGMCLSLAGFTSTSQVGRLRDAWIEKDSDGEPIIAVYTRNGGGNREHWDDDDDDVEAGKDCDCTGCIATYQLPAMEQYIRDVDDDFDRTYATFYFRAPPEFRDSMLDVASDHINMSEKWLEAIDKINPKSS
jgi:hypothetical protein